MNLEEDEAWQKYFQMHFSDAIYAIQSAFNYIAGWRSGVNTNGFPVVFQGAHVHLLFHNWVNYFVSQETSYDLFSLK